MLSAEEIASFRPEPLPRAQDCAFERARRAAERGGCSGPGQQLGERWPVGCVALEITQRCNLDCTLCYLSEHSEAVRDLPIAAVFERIDAIRAHYGTGVDVQVTGGDPTLRRRDELVAIVQRLAEQGQRPTLMTNGINADRALLRELAHAGLVDVAFHVDTTQRRKGYASEVALNAIRQRYIEASRGLGLSVMFNTTIHADNLREVPMLVAFFRANADVVRTVSFQLQADTGRGVLRGRGEAVTADGIWQRIHSGLGTRLDTGTVRVGHADCSRYGLALIVGGVAHDLLASRNFVQRLQRATAGLTISRDGVRATVRRFAGWLLRNPAWIPGALAAGLELAWRIGPDVVRSRGRLHTLSFLTHNFMHACALERDRIHACVFKTMTADGPISMCMHNAKRDEFILEPVQLPDGRWFDPVRGTHTLVPVIATVRRPEDHGLKRARGRTRQRLLAKREAS